MVKKGHSPLALTLALALAPALAPAPAPPPTQWHLPSSTYTYGLASHVQDVAPIRYAMPTPATAAKPDRSHGTIHFSQLFRHVERANVRNRGSEAPRLDLLRRDDNDDGCDLSLAPPSQDKDKGKVKSKGKGKIPAQERYLEMKKQRKERSVRVEADHGQEIKKRKVTAKGKGIKNIKKSKPQNGDGIEAISVSSSSPSSANLSL